MPSTELVSPRAESEEDIVSSLDTNDFPKDYRNQLCEKAVAKISQGFAKMSENRDADRSQYYYYRLVGPHEHSVGESKMRTALAFKCPSEPEIFIELKKLREKYLVWVFVRDVDLNDEGEDNCYLVQFAHKVTPGKQTFHSHRGGEHFGDQLFYLSSVRSRIIRDTSSGCHQHRS